jgi:hypothetical protein
MRLFNKVLTIALINLQFFLMTLSVAQSETYYIDFQTGSDRNSGKAISTPWKFSPGMTNFTGSYTHSYGDVFVFKGGVTWTALSGQVLNVTYSGGASTPDQYVGGQRCGQSGSPSCNGGTAWGSGYPVFDGNSAGGIITYVNNKSNIIFDGIKFYNATMHSSSAGQALYVTSGSNIEVKNCWFETLTVNGFSYQPAAGASYSKIYFHDNHVRRIGRTYIQPITDAYVDDIQIYNNLFEGPADYGTKGGFHQDGIIIGGSSTTSAYSITNLKIYNNKFYGDWSTNGPGITGQIYLNGDTIPNQPSTQYTSIYNNVFAYENNTWRGTGTAQIARMLYVLGRHDNLLIYNNTFSADATIPEVPSCIYMGTDKTTNVKIKNNIFSGCYQGIMLDSGMSTYPEIDYNLYNTSEGTHLIDSDIGDDQTCPTISCCQTQFTPPLELHGIEAIPKFLALPSGGVVGSGNWRLQSDSSARTGGANLGAPYTTDIDGNVGTSRIGAYEYVGKISSPKNLKIIN